MSTSEARIEANRRNAAHSTGPKTPEGKEKSRQNALKHGMTGNGIVLTPEEAAEVELRFSSFRAELQPSGTIGVTLVRRAATLAVRMEKCADLEMKASAERVTRAMVEFEVPDGATAEEAIQLRAGAGRRAAFDPSKEGRLARSYEAAAERGFFRALRELRLIEKNSKAAGPSPDQDKRSYEKALGSFFDLQKRDDEMVSHYPELAMPERDDPFEALMADRSARVRGRIDVPFTIGKAR